MKRLLGILILLLSLSCITWWIQSNDANTVENEVDPSLNRLERKHIPSDEFFMQRTFPDAALSMQAYTNALQAAKENSYAEPRNNFENFDRAWTVEGPGNLGARINTVAYHPDNTDIILAGFSAGGIFKTTNGGKDWTPVFDEQLFLAIGDIVFDPTDPTIVYAGTGDPNISGFPFLGDGLYKSTDTGTTWEKIGLEETRIISKILIHPTNSKILYVAAMGLPFEPTKERGLYQSTDGGTTWRQILFLGEETGAIDAVLDVNDPSIIYAAGWDRMRSSKISKTFGLGAKVHRSFDGGATWEQLKHILPQDAQSRIGLATAQDAVFALYVDTLHNYQGLYRSFDKGNSWEIVPTNKEVEDAIVGFGWYFGQVRVNPLDKQDITILGVVSFRTKDGGATWNRLTLNSTLFPHVDHHDVVYHPSGKMLLATDGGLYESDKQSVDWRDIENIPATQTYRVAFNPHLPELYYGGFQDNGSAAGNAQSINEWENYMGADGFRTIFHPTESKVFYAEYQLGKMEVTQDGGETWTNATAGIAQSDRKGWDMPYIMSPHDPSTLYAGTERVYKSTNGIRPYWQPISMDLTDGPIYDRPQSISAISQSPINREHLYVGTMDANVWRTVDDGNTWEAIHGQLPERSVTDIVASADNESTIFVTYSGYKDNDFSPHIFRSDDLGDNWYSVAGNLPPLAVNALVVPEGYEHQVLFAATDGGVYGSLNGGEQWERLGTNMPIVAAYDLTWNTGINTLIAGTFARSILSYPLEGIVEPPNNTLSSVSAATLANSPVLLYPNPVQHTLNIAFQKNSANETLYLSFFNIQGQQVLSFKAFAGQEVLIQKEVSALPNGVYLLKINGESVYRQGQFVKGE